MGSGNNDAQLMRVTAADRGEHGMARTDALGGESNRTAELAIAALEAQARAQVQARFFMASKMRRTWDDVEIRLLRECKRPRFAAAAWFVKPIGKDEAKWPRGLSIRFAEAALRVAGNIDIQIQTIFDDEWKRVVRVSVLDLEGNFGYTKEISLDKTVERKYAGNREVISVRENSNGEQTFLLRTTEDELITKQNAMISKEIRTQGLRLIPGDILDECKLLIQETIRSKVAEDPEAARKVVFDNFAEIGVMPADIAKYLEHDTSSLLPAEVVTLRGIYTAIKNGDASWKDVMQAKFGAEEGEESDAAKKLRERLAKKTAAPKQEQKPPAEQKPAEERLTSQPRPKPPAEKPVEKPAETVEEEPQHESTSIRRYARGEMPDAFGVPLWTEAYHEGRHYRAVHVEGSDDDQKWLDIGAEPKPKTETAEQRAPSGRTGFSKGGR